MASLKFKTVEVDGTGIFYRESGQTGTPALLLLHGFPTSSHVFRDLIPLLQDRFHIVAPDLPGFGRSDIPSSFAAWVRFPLVWSSVTMINFRSISETEQPA